MHSKYIKKILCITAIFFLLLIRQGFCEEVSRPRIGLVLSGGGARGFAHIGVLKVLDSLKIPIDYIAGTSMGAVVGGLYAIGYSPEQLDSLARNIEWPVIFSDKPTRSRQTYLEKWDGGRFQLTLKIRKRSIQEPTGLIYGQKISLLLNRLTAPLYENADFDSLPLPFRCVAADLITGNEIVLRRGSLAKALRASMAVPSIFTPIEWGDSLLVDGGVLNNMPVDVVKDMGADFIIAVNVGTPLRSRDELTGAISILLQSFSLAGSQKEQRNLKSADLVLEPALDNFAVSDFSKRKVISLINLGKEEAFRHIETLTALTKTLPSYIHDIPLPRFDKGIIYGLTISGNKILPFSFIYQILGLKPGETFTISLLEDRLEHLYSLGYFQTVNYRLEHVNGNRYRIEILVNERVGSFLRLGIRYQDDKKGIVGVNLKVKDFPFPGILNDMTYLFSGQQIFEWELSYPRRMFGSRLYPYLLGFYQDIPLNIYQAEEKIARYHYRSSGISAGLGFIISNYGEIRSEYMLEELNMTPSIAYNESFIWPEWKYPLHLGRIYGNFDLLDDPLVPKHGYQASIDYEQTLDFFDQRESYRRFYTEQNFYGTLIPRNTSSIHFFLGLSENTELYRYYYLSKSMAFIGYNNDELSGKNLAIYRFEHLFNWTDIISLVGIVNAGHIWNSLDDINFSDRLKTGFGLGVRLNTIIGPVNYLVGFSKEHTIQYLTFGFSLKTRIGRRR